MKVYELHINDIFEGVFDSVKEVALYMDVPVTVVTTIINGNYKALNKKYNRYQIVQVAGYDGDELESAESANCPEFEDWIGNNSTKGGIA